VDSSAPRLSPHAAAASPEPAAGASHSVDSSAPRLPPHATAASPKPAARASHSVDASAAGLPPHATAASPEQATRTSHSVDSSAPGLPPHAAAASPEPAARASHSVDSSAPRLPPHAAAASPEPAARASHSVGFSLDFVCSAAFASAFTFPSTSERIGNGQLQMATIKLFIVSSHCTTRSSKACHLSSLLPQSLSMRNRCGIPCNACCGCVSGLGRPCGKGGTHSVSPGGAHHTCSPSGFNNAPMLPRYRHASSGASRRICLQAKPSRDRKRPSTSDSLDAQPLVSSDGSVSPFRRRLAFAATHAAAFIMLEPIVPPLARSAGEPAMAVPTQTAAAARACT